MIKKNNINSKVSKIDVNNKKKSEVVETKTSNSVEIKEVGKKINGDVFLILGLVLVLGLGFLVMRDKNAGPTYELPLTLTGEAGLQELNYSEYLEKINNDEEFVVIIESATCSHCVTYMPIAEQFAKNNSLPLYYIDTDTISREEWSSFASSNTYFKKSRGNWGTPTTIVLAGREAVDYIKGVTDEESLLKLYHKYFDIEEK